MSFSSLHSEIIQCKRCRRLRNHCEEIASKKKKEFREWTYWGKPVPGFGDPRARLWIVGLAPAAHGANRTGRMFTGDSSGKWLYRALFKVGFCNQTDSYSLDDGMKLEGVYISAAARCAPPDNKPSRVELQHCHPFLKTERGLLSHVKVVLATGAIAFQAVCRLFNAPTGLKFGHGALYQLGKISLLASYHPSRQNTQTGRLTEEMWDEIFKTARTVVED